MILILKLSISKNKSFAENKIFHQIWCGNSDGASNYGKGEWGWSHEWPQTGRDLILERVGNAEATNDLTWGRYNVEKGWWG